MRAARPLLYVEGGVCPGGGVGGSLSGRTPSPCGQTDTCEIITLPQTSFAGDNNK